MQSLPLWLSIHVNTFNSLALFLAIFVPTGVPFMDGYRIYQQYTYKSLSVRRYQGLYSLNGKASYRQVSGNLEVIVTVLLWKLASRQLSNFRAIGKV